MKIFLLTNSYYPDPMGIAPLADGLAAELHGRGHDVSVITSFPWYPNWKVPSEYRGRWLTLEDRDGVKVFRSFIFVRPRATVFAKALSYASFTVSSTFNVVRSGKPDIALVISPPPTLVLSAWIWKLFYRARIILDVQDIVPDAAISSGIMTNPFEISVFRLIERLAYRIADSIVVVAANFVPNLLAKNVPADKIDVVFNWVDLDLMRPLPRNNKTRTQLRVSDDDFLVMYAGNIGASQGIEVVLDAAMLLSHREDIHFAIVGGGTMAASLRARADQLSLKRVSFMDAVPFEKMPEVQAEADLGLVVQKANILDVNLPSKIPAILASGRPIVAAVNPNGDAHRILHESGAACLASPGDPAGIATAIADLAGDRPRARRMGVLGREYAVAHFAKQTAVDQYLQVFKKALRRGN